MDKNKIILVSALVAVPVLGGLAYYQYAKNSIIFTFNGIEFPNRNLENILHIKIKFNIQSSLGFPFTIESSIFNIFEGLDLLGTASQMVPLKVPNNSIVTYEADAVVDASILGNSVFDIVIDKLTGGSSTNSFLVKGIAKVRVDVPVLNIFTIGIPVDENYSL